MEKLSIGLIRRIDMSMKCKIDLHCDLCDNNCEYYQEMVPLKQGKWVLSSRLANKKIYKCPFCLMVSRLTTPHCPYCGAELSIAL